MVGHKIVSIAKTRVGVFLFHLSFSLPYSSFGAHWFSTRGKYKVQRLELSALCPFLALCHLIYAEQTRVRLPWVQIVN